VTGSVARIFGGAAGARAIRTKVQLDLFERNPDEVTVSPDHSAFTDRPKIVERQIEVDRQHVEPVQTNARALVRYITDAARKYAGVTGEEQQSLPINARPSDRAAFFSSGFQHLVDNRHDVPCVARGHICWANAYLRRQAFSANPVTPLHASVLLSFASMLARATPAATSPSKLSQAHAVIRADTILPIPKPRIDALSEQRSRRAQYDRTTAWPWWTRTRAMSDGSTLNRPQQSATNFVR
jgi:hypothetical protein